MTSAKWSDEAWAAISPLFRRITGHPFLTGLTEGTLPRENFHFYLTQDALYLNDFSKALAGVAVKSQDQSVTEAFLNFAAGAFAVELELHRSYLGRIDPAAEPTPSCLLYTSFLHRQLALAPLPVAVAAVLPCFRIYQAVGEHILAQPRRPHNPYQSWIDTYGGEEFAKSAASAIAIADSFADETAPALRPAMTRAFVLCSKMEWMFWDSAWRMETWPV